jgi:hypothetical protein
MKIKMFGLLRAWVAAGCFLLNCGSAVNGQGTPPQPVVAEKPTEAAKPAETKRIERDGFSQVVSYTLAAVGTIIVMVLICMPARRE